MIAGSFPGICRGVPRPIGRGCRLRRERALRFYSRIVPDQPWRALGSLGAHVPSSTRASHHSFRRAPQTIISVGLQDSGKLRQMSNRLLRRSTVNPHAKLTPDRRPMAACLSLKRWCALRDLLPWIVLAL